MLVLRARSKKSQAQIPSALGCGGPHGSTRYSIWQLADQPCFSPSNWSAASITACGSIETRPSSRRSVCVVLYTLSGLRRTTLGVPKGRLRSGRVGPNNATTGTRNAAARCMGPVSPPTKRRARRISAINFPTEHFTRTMVAQHRHAPLHQSACHRAERLRRPALCSPTRTGVEDCQRLAAIHFKLAIGPGLDGGINGKGWLNVFQRLACKLRRQRQRMLDHVRPLHVNGMGVEHARRALARLRRSDADPRARGTRCQRRAYRTLEVERDFVLPCAHFAPARTNLAPRLMGKQRPAPTGELGHMHPVGEGLPFRAGSQSLRIARTQQPRPTLFHQPADLQIGFGAAQGRNRWHAVNDVAHRAESHHQEPVPRGDGETVFGEHGSLLLRRYGSAHRWPRPPLQDCSRARKSVVEWSLGSPTISTRPPYARTSSRSGTFSCV